MSRLITLTAILVPFAGVILAATSAWGAGFQWVELGLLLGMYVVTVLGITIGFHRLFVHRSFETHRWMKVLWVILGSMAVQGSLFHWAARHRRHHQHADTPEDPHSPQYGGDGMGGFCKGFWHAHIGWLFAPNPPRLERYIKDLTSSRTLQVTSNLFFLWVLIGLLIPALIGGALNQSWSGFWAGFLWGGLVRIFLVHHVTWSVNSACHLWGRQTFKSDDESRNNFLFGMLALGEGWHNTHHAFPTSARHGLRWWEFDASYCVIRTMELVGFAWNVQIPSREMQMKKRRVQRQSDELAV
ncbi:acyl-CoA desaturase [Rubinisphaera margarita]|uniref:acyl-CoA desaturase n=1 Tax=Rubinisphaera margarita TaxID=2909586 RepID=UPI001EE78E40|nr:acyl-CoA desaturase [Rubinisphaera margarita]MCG6158169.1 acyl-CoA desaturase [Rubinisphaera margarita]